jgi:hypothetical protein
MYQLEHSPADRLGSARKCLVTERGFIRRRKGGPLELGKGTPTELDVEPRLAARLNALRKEEREERVAILTLAVSQTGAYGLVGVEILVDSYPRFRSGGFLPDIEYRSLFVTPEGSTYSRGEDQHWEQPERMRPLARVYKGKLQALKLQMQDMQLAQTQAMTNNMWGQVMREAALAASAQAGRERRLTGH